MTSIGINGFGRIGRMVLRACLEKKLKVVAINDPFVSLDFIVYLFKYDSTHGRYKGCVASAGNNLVIDGQIIEVFREKDPTNIPWKRVGVDFVVEATGVFTNQEKASLHLNAGAKYVVITAPSPDVPMFVMGVNHTCYDPTMRIVSNACCTTNCVAPLAKVIHENFTIVEGLMLSVHALTPSQRVVDSPGTGIRREARGALQNIIPGCSGAATAIGRVLPELEGKLTGMVMKVPVANVSVVDLTVRLGQEASYEDIKKTVQSVCETDMKGIMSWTEDDVVSSDFIGCTYSCVFDVKSGIPLNKQFVKLIAWYDNEFAYAARVVDLIQFIKSKV